MTLVIEARRIPFETVSKEMAAAGTSFSGWSAEALAPLSTWDKSLLPALLPLVRESMTAVLSGQSRQSKGPSTTVELQVPQEEEVRFTRRLLHELGDLEAAYFQVRDARKHLRYLAEDSSCGGEEGGEYSWWPTGDEDRTEGRVVEMALLQHRTGFNKEEEDMYNALLEGRGVGEPNLPHPLAPSADPAEAAAAKGMDATVDLAMTFDIRRGGECTGMGSAALFGGHGVHLHPEKNDDETLKDQ